MLSCPAGAWRYEQVKQLIINFKGPNSMIKRNLLMAIGALLATGAFAAGLTPQQALERAATSPQGKKLVKTSVQPQLVYTSIDEAGAPAVYVFNQPQNGGTLLLSADDIALPVLGYTNQGSLDPNNIPPQLEYWMGEYGKEINYAKSRGIKTKVNGMDYPADWEFISPLLSTLWDQGAPYNALTPTIGNVHTPTGCVATAMAQVMNYWKYPEIGEGHISYYDNYNRQTMEMYFDRQPFAWDQMLDTYKAGQYTDAQAEAVAYLMKAVGYASEMIYMSGASGTQSAKAAIGIIKYFKYDGNLRHLQRYLYSESEWAAIIYDQIKNVGPLFYDGQSPNGGHAFVLDGYDGAGYFHFNWGWGGTANGYYLLNALNPSSQGIGGSYGGFNVEQGIIAGIKKPTGDNPLPFTPQLDLRGSLSMSISGSTAVCKLIDYEDSGFYNSGMMDVSVRFSLELTNTDGTGEPIYMDSYSPTASQLVAISPGQSYNGATVQPAFRLDTSLPNGKYKCRLVYRNGNNGTVYYNFMLPLGYYDYVYLTKTGPTSYTVETPGSMMFDVTDIKVTTPLYYGNPCVLEITATNPYDIELTQCVIPTLYYEGEVSFDSDTQLITVGPNQTVTTTATYTFNRVTGGSIPTTAKPKEYTIGAFDYISGKEYGQFGTVTMYRSSTSITVNLVDFKLANAVAATEMPSGITMYEIPSALNLDMEATVEVGGNNAFLATPLIMQFYQNDPETGTPDFQVFEKQFNDLLYISSGNTGTLKQTISFNDFDYSKTYTVKLYYKSGTQLIALGDLGLTASAGVNGVNPDNTSIVLTTFGNTVKAFSEAGVVSIDLYSTDGRCVVSRKFHGLDSATIDTAALPQGIYVVNAKDANGKSTTLKISK